MFKGRLVLSLHPEQDDFYSREFFPGQRGAPWHFPNPGEGALGGLRPMAHPAPATGDVPRRVCLSPLSPTPWPFLGSPLDKIY